MQKLFIISNEAIYENNNLFFCDNKDLKSTPEGLEKNFEVNLIARKSNIKRSHKINIKNIKIFSSLISFLREIVLSFKNKKTNYLLISISPYTFFACIFLRLFNKKPIIYLRSNGYDEYKIILGSLGKFFYHLMFILITRFSILISCREYILMGKKGYVVSPSQLDLLWHQNHVKPSINEIKLLYVGRIKKEKGIFSLINLIKDQSKINLTIVGASKEDTKKINQSNVNILEIINDKNGLINLYDKNNITILPSYTEGYPMVVLESLSRQRPIIIFKEIEHVVEDRKGIFVSNRNYQSLCEKINYIIDNYNSIQESMKLNKLPDNDSFINKLKEILS